MIDQAKVELTPRDHTLFEEILSKDNNSLLPAERELLVARRCYLTEEELAKFQIEGDESEKLVTYADLTFNDLKKTAKEKGITIEKSLKREDILALLEEFDNLKEGDEFQGQIAMIATEEMIKVNELEGQLEVGQMYFAPKTE
jgi:hypothetical protein